MTPGRTWSVVEAKARLGDLLAAVERDGPQTISRRGRAVAVVVSVEQWERRNPHRGSLADFFATSPLRELGGELELPSRDEAMRESSR
ncbi:type II toxin-antitoxin system Phd/YefM family antitoxin [Jiangella muralis]|uniref:type II toxin-antitoxin system Phd/YefM family antitoxin n=1 Tax=Jiangella muralis TaxID=702383 RepID=UPI00069D5F57|nr:type II toxin-antitoxin system Phd/YefM family antitoxin [Jiangella muralis]